MEAINEITGILQGAEGFYVGVGVMKDKTITHYLFTESFPTGDMLKSHNEIKKLIIAELEK
jgi:hypothetical protein